jgi:hypothetical protein
MGKKRRASVLSPSIATCVDEKVKSQKSKFKRLSQIADPIFYFLLFTFDLNKVRHANFRR